MNEITVFRAVFGQPVALDAVNSFWHQLSELIECLLKWWAAFHFHRMNSIKTTQSISNRCANQYQIKAYLKRILLVNYYYCYYFRVFVPFRFEVRAVWCKISGTKKTSYFK